MRITVRPYLHLRSSAHRLAGGSLLLGAVIAVVAGAVLMAATAAGRLLSVHVGLFGFRESLAVPYAGMSLVEEAAGAVLLAGAAVLFVAGRPRSGARTVRVWPPAD